MTSALYDFSARLKASETGRAVWTASTARQVIREDALVVLVAAAVAEKRSPWLATIMGTSGTIPQAKIPLHGKSREIFWKTFGKKLVHALSDYQPKDKHDEDILPPQFVVATEKAWEQLLYGAARYAFDKNANLHPKEKRALKVLLWAEKQRTVPGSQVVVTLDSFLSEHFAVGDPNAEGLLLPMWKWITEGAKGAAQLELSETGWYNDFCRTPLPIDQQKLALSMAKKLQDSADRGLEAIDEVAKGRKGERERIEARRELDNLLKEMIKGQEELLAPILQEIPELFKRAGIQPNPGIRQDVAGDQKAWRLWYALPENASWETWKGSAVPRQRGTRHQYSADLWTLITSSQFDLEQEIAGAYWEYNLQMYDDDYWARSVEDGRGVIGMLHKDSKGLYVDSPQAVVRLRSGNVVVDRSTLTEFTIRHIEGNGDSNTLRLGDNASLLVDEELELVPKPSGATFHPSKVYRLKKQVHWAFSEKEKTQPKPKVDLSAVDRSILGNVDSLRVNPWQI